MKKVQLKLVGLDGNAFAIMGAFQSQARKEGWSNEEIEKVLAETQSGDYDNLLRVIIQHSEEPIDPYDDFDDAEEEEQCQECYGSGEIEYEKEVIYNGIDGREVDYEPYYETCSICDGTGYVTY